MVTETVSIAKRISQLKLRSAQRFRISPEKCHIGHIVLQAMTDNPSGINQIEVSTDASESHGSVMSRSCRLASALRNYGLLTGDVIAILGPNHLDLAVPYYASHYNGHTLCGIDAMVTGNDLQHIFKIISPKMVFCLKSQLENVKGALAHCNMDARIVVFDDVEFDLEEFISDNKGTEIDFRPAEFDQSKTIAWLMLTSGTTGLPKAAIIPYETLLNALSSWWCQFNERIYTMLTFGTIQWMSALLFYISGPLMNFKRIQTAVPPTPQWLIQTINKYKPTATAWTPHLLGQFLLLAGNLCDMTSFKYIAIGGSSIDKTLIEDLKSKCDAEIFLIYGMTELLVPVFEFSMETPFGSSGKPLEKFQYRLVTEGGQLVDTNETGELWIKGDEFFKGYLNNPEETNAILTEDGWFRTGDIFYRDDQDYYFFVERKRLLIKYQGNFVAPLQLEEVIKKHPGVEEACVVGLPSGLDVELPVGAIVTKNGANVHAQEIFDLLNSELPPLKQLHGGLFFLESLPETPSGKLHRAQIREMAVRTTRTMPNNKGV